MHVDGKISGGYAILCNCGNAFATERLGLALECPACGHTELGVDVAADYYLRSKRPSSSHDVSSPPFAAGLAKA
ncbi:hypothetical protein [Aquibaculum arenosum]|uniref:Uncharacterized protein n=1 Tax=Aquibaculum arenosum TaxID=3032591 RepID=A0ABT5YLZ6_9PROT|nr:hypothetical protein [Fodinicurvata sp. CAU 1616]MDF2095976.1 hypothetical protein [Fodinicurvata sp. CAU 1616]